MQRYHCLSQTQAAIIGWHLLVTEDLEPTGTQTVPNQSQEQAVLEHSPGERNHSQA